MGGMQRREGVGSGEREALMSPTNPPKKKRRGRLVLGCLVILLGLPAILVALAPTLVSPLLAGPISSAASDAVPGEVEVSGISLSWFGGQSIDRVVIRDDEGEVLSASVTTGLSLLDAAGGSRDLGDVRITGEANLDKTGAGAFRLLHALSAPGSGGPSEPPSVPPALAGVLALEGFTLYTTEGGSRTDLAVVTVNSTIVVGDPIEIDGALAFPANDGSGSLDILLNGLWDKAGAITTDALSGRANLTLTDAPMSVAQAVAPSRELAAVLGESFTLDLAAEGDASRAEAGFSLSSAPTTGSGAFIYDAGVLTQSAPIKIETETGVLADLAPEKILELEADGVEVLAWPRVLFETSALRVDVERAMSGDYRGVDLAAALTSSGLDLRVPGAEGQGTMRVESPGLTLSLRGFDQGGAKLDASIDLVIDGLDPRTLVLSAGGPDLLDANGAVRPPEQTDFNASLRMDRVPTAMIKPWIATDALAGLDLQNDIGPTLNVSASATSTDGRLNGTVSVVADQASATGEFFFEDGRIEGNPGAPVVVVLRRSGAIARGVMGDAMGDLEILDGDLSFEASRFSVDIDNLASLSDPARALRALGPATLTLPPVRTVVPGSAGDVPVRVRNTTIDIGRFEAEVPVRVTGLLNVGDGARDLELLIQSDAETALASPPGPTGYAVTLTPVGSTPILEVSGEARFGDALTDAVGATLGLTLVPDAPELALFGVTPDAVAVLAGPVMLDGSWTAKSDGLGDLDLGITSPGVRTDGRIRVTEAGGVWTLLEPASVAVTLPRRLVNERLGTARVGRSVKLNADVQRLVAGESIVVEGGFGVDRMALEFVGADPVTLERITGSLRTLGDDHYRVTMGTPEDAAIGVSGDLELLGAVAGDPAATGDLALNGFPTAVIDAIAGASGRLEMMVGPVMDAGLTLKNAPRDSGKMKITLTGEYADALVDGWFRGGFFRANAPMTLELRNITEEFGTELARLLPVFAKIVKDPERNQPATVVVEGWKLPIGSELPGEARGDMTIDPGTLSLDFGGIARFLGQDVTVGERLEPFTAKLRSGVVTYDDLVIPLGEFELPTTGRIDIANKRQRVVVEAPVGALAGEAIGGQGGQFAGVVGQFLGFSLVNEGELGSNSWSLKPGERAKGEEPKPEEIIRGVLDILGPKNDEPEGP